MFISTAKILSIQAFVQRSALSDIPEILQARTALQQGELNEALECLVPIFDLLDDPVVRDVVQAFYADKIATVINNGVKGRGFAILLFTTASRQKWCGYTVGLASKRPELHVTFDDDIARETARELVEHLIGLELEPSTKGVWRDYSYELGATQASSAGLEMKHADSYWQAVDYPVTPVTIKQLVVSE